MSNKIDILAPYTRDGSSVVTMQRWLKMVGDAIMMNEPIAELVAGGMVIYVHAPGEGSLSSIAVGPGQNVLSGGVLGQVSLLVKDQVDWENFDQVTAILEDFADKSGNRQQLKDANEALGQLLGVSDQDVFRKMNVEDQNKFLQNVVDQYQAHGLSPADVAQKLLEGLHLRAPRFTPATPAPVFGIRGPAGPAGPGMSTGGGVHYPQGVMPQQQQGYAPPAGYPPQQPGMYPAYPPQQGGYPPYPPQGGYPPGQYPQGQWPAPPQQGGYPPYPPQQPPQQIPPYVPPVDEDDNNK